MKDLWNENDKVIGIDKAAQGIPQAQMAITQMKIFMRDDYKNTEAYERDVNNFLYKLCKEQVYHQLTSMKGEIHFVYGSNLS